MPKVLILLVEGAEVEAVLQDEFVASSNGSFQRFLVKWRDHSDSDATWISEAAEFRALDPLLLDEYLQTYSPVSSSFQPRIFGIFIL